MAALWESPRKFSHDFNSKDYNILEAEHGIGPTPCEEHNSPAESTRLLPRAGGISLVGAKSRSTPGSHLVPQLNTLWKMHLPTPLPGASWPWPPPHGLEDCTCNNLRTLTEYLLQNLVHPGIPDCPFFSANKQAKGKGGGKKKKAISKRHL